jgi:hypothetical protein
MYFLMKIKMVALIPGSILVAGHAGTKANSSN